MSNDKTYIVRKRGLKQPRAADKGGQLKYAMKRARKQRHT